MATPTKRGRRTRYVWLLTLACGHTAAALQGEPNRVGADYTCHACGNPIVGRFARIVSVEKIVCRIP